MPALTLQHVNKFFGQGTSRVQVLNDVNFATQPGELSLVLGPSGSGKSTFLTIAGGIQTPTDGRVTVDGQALASMAAKDRDKLRLHQIGFILQAHNLVPYLTVRDQFALVDRIKPQGNLSPTALHQLLDELGIARALYQDPAIILADEPTAALDSDRVKVVGRLLQQLVQDHQKAVVVVTHDLRLREFADHVYQLMDGQLTLEA